MPWHCTYLLLEGRVAQRRVQLPPNVSTTWKGVRTMLVLSRRTGEKIVLPTLGITVEVVDVKGGAVRLGIDAPPDVRIMRQEIEDARRSYGATASASPDREPCCV